MSCQPFSVFPIHQCHDIIHGDSVKIDLTHITDLSGLENRVKYVKENLIPIWLSKCDQAIAQRRSELHRELQGHANMMIAEGDKRDDTEAAKIIRDLTDGLPKAIKTMEDELRQQLQDVLNDIQSKVTGCPAGYSVDMTAVENA